MRSVLLRVWQVPFDTPEVYEFLFNPLHTALIEAALSSPLYRRENSATD